MERQEKLKKITPNEAKYVKEITIKEVIQVEDGRHKDGFRDEEVEVVKTVIDFEAQEEDKKLRFEMALEEGQDPLKAQGIAQLYEDWQFIRKYRAKYGR